MDYSYHFSAGPSMLPREVLRRLSDELLAYGGDGLPITEITRHSPEYGALYESVTAGLRAVLDIPRNYHVLLLPGFSPTQFAAVPCNLISRTGRADYVLSGQYSKRAYLEAKRYGDVSIIASSAGAGFLQVPRLRRSMIRQDAAYVHVCFNNSVYGTCFREIPDTGSVPLVADLSSCLLSYPLDISRFGLVYADCQMNLSPGGMTLVIVREDLLGTVHPMAAGDHAYFPEDDDGSMRPTPPPLCLYSAKLVCEWITANGGLEAIGRKNAENAAFLYDYLDHQHYYTAPVEHASRSSTHVTFLTGSSALDRRFIAEAEHIGLRNLAGHHSIGGMRATISNALPREALEMLVTFMKIFAKENPKD